MGHGSGWQAGTATRQSDTGHRLLGGAVDAVRIVIGHTNVIGLARRQATDGIAIGAGRIGRRVGEVTVAAAAGDTILNGVVVIGILIARIGHTEIDRRGTRRRRSGSTDRG